MKSKLEYWEQRYGHTNNITSASVIGEPAIVNERAKQKFAKTVISIVDELCINLENASLLAAGCGTGAVSEVLASRSKSLYGFDFSREAIQVLESHGTSGEYVVAAVSDIPFQKQFDIVTAFSILYHIIGENEWRSAIKELANATLNGGYLLIRINWAEEPLGEQSPDSHFYDRSRYAYQSEFKRNSLTLIDVIDLPVKPMILYWSSEGLIIRMMSVRSIRAFSYSVQIEIINCSDDQYRQIINSPRQLCSQISNSPGHRGR